MRAQRTGRIQSVFTQRSRERARDELEQHDAMLGQRLEDEPSFETEPEPAPVVRPPDRRREAIARHATRVRQAAEDGFTDVPDWAHSAALDDGLSHQDATSLASLAGLRVPGSGGA